ncbi:MAG TPA: hypothetical protein VJV03_09960 [Pyrinomonadaceae bacterium]|nr:hypothetical protein [Pyrinomonadaceae bacterium]
MTEKSDEELIKEAISVKSAFERELSRHGHGFQFAVLKKARELGRRDVTRMTLMPSLWKFSAAEFPVSIHGVGTRIDFLLFKERGGTLGTAFMVSECKKANPAYSNWCFIRAPFSYRNMGTDHFTIDHLKISDDQKEVWSHTSAIGTIKDRAYHLGLPIKTGEKGEDQKGQPREQIEQAVTQVLRGLNGLIQTLAQHPKIVAKYDTVSFIPVIFTTANLWVSSDDLFANLETGNLDEHLQVFERANWLWYQYNTSPGIKHSLSDRKPDELTELLKLEYIRTVAIVSSSGIEDFLTLTSDLFI